jgi:tungstate transport system ATP-binding protein
MLYSVRNLTQVFDGRTVLDIPRLSISRGRIYGLLGPNGSGKTTLLSILGFLAKPSTGTLFYGGRPVDFSEKCLQPLRRQVVLVNQHPIMFSTSVYKNVEFGLKVRKAPAGERARVVEESLDRVGLRHLKDAPGAGLSGGETQRVAIARALACKPKVILFDEPTASVDAASQTAIEKIIRDLCADGRISIIISTHNLSQAARVAEERIFLFGGRLGASENENIFSGKVFFDEKRCYCLLNGGPAIPIRPTDRETVSIAIHPKSVVLTPVDDGGATADEGFDGRIVQVAEEAAFIRVTLDIGVPLNVLLRPGAYRSLGVHVGDAVGVRCPEHGIRVL